MTDRFKNAVDALVYAFFNDTLAKGTCAACACANIVAHSAGVKIDSNNIGLSIELPGGFYTSSWFQLVTGNKNKVILSRAIKCVESTGFSQDEFSRIEKAFERSTDINYLDYGFYTKSEIMQDQYNGLMAVLDVLCEIEGIEDPSEYKELFAMP